MLYSPNQQQDGYCYLCRQDFSPSDLKQCVICQNWFCKNHIASVQDPDSLNTKMVDLCDKDQGKIVLH